MGHNPVAPISQCDSTGPYYISCAAFCGLQTPYFFVLDAMVHLTDYMYSIFSLSASE
jgi:hypothetical protein